MIVTLTINPALDKSTSVSRITSEKKLRCEPMIIEAGGGGINVSKAIQELGGISQAVFPVGGSNGQLLEEILKENELLFKSIPVSPDTRENFTVTESTSNNQFRFVLPGERLNDRELKNVLSLISEMNPFPDFIVASGSLPPGTPDDFYCQVAAICTAKGAKCIVDASGLPMSCSSTENIYLLKVSLSELCNISGADDLQLHEIEEAAKEIINKRNCNIVVVSLGQSGALLVTKDEIISTAAPMVKRISTVGAGDSMVGGMVWKMQQSSSLKEMIQFGVACGTAAIMNPGTQLFKKQDAFKLYDWLRQQDKGGF